MTGCDGPQSTLAPAGSGAEQTLQLFIWMAAGAALVWVLVIGLAIVAFRAQAGDVRVARMLIVGGGVALPTIVLFVLLGFGLRLLPELTAPGDGLRIAVSGEQWWWRVRYEPPDGPAVASANEIRLPAGVRTEFTLTSTDVIHSLWIPSLGGKMDMIPGRTTRLALEPTRTGVFRGVCAEFCGASHTFMAFDVVVMEQDEFTAWLERQAEPARPPAGALAAQGRALFRDNGCGACHRIAGTAAAGVIGPDLTHVGARASLGAGTLPAEIEAFAQWIGHTDAVKPEVRMPAYDMLTPEQLTAIGHYLKGLQ
ncbi:MAG: cytochrome c oxidase subunit II [Gammaproteobacteria bacterium]|nr:cytochrome c oxidase subunit II [Gammaproteobacteria bacterium]